MASKPKLLDGALGSLLPFESQEHPLWSTHTVIENPNLIKQIHKDYINAGSQLIQTSTYQTGKVLLTKYYPELKYEDVVKKSIDLIQDAIDEVKKEVRTVGSIGPYGASLANGAEYTGNYGSVTSIELEEFHKDRLEILMNDPRVDLIGLETIPNIEEIKVLLSMLSKNHKPFYLSLSVKSESLADGTSIPMLLSVIKAQKLENFKYVGVNCLSINDSISWLNYLSPLGIKLIVYPNSGEKWDAQVRRFTSNPEKQLTWKQYVLEIKKYDIGIIGGCCRTNPKTIKEMKSVIDDIYINLKSY